MSTLQRGEQSMNEILYIGGSLHGKVLSIKDSQIIPLKIIIPLSDGRSEYYHTKEQHTPAGIYYIAVLTEIK